MKQHQYHSLLSYKCIVLAVLTLCINSVSVFAQNEYSQQTADSLRTVIKNTDGEEKFQKYIECISYAGLTDDIHVKDQLYKEMEEEAILQKNEKMIVLAFSNHLSHLRSFAEFGDDRVEEQFKKATEVAKKYEYWDILFELYNAMMSEYLSKHNIDEANDLVTRMYSEAKELDYQIGIGIALIRTANILCLTGSNGEEIPYLEEGVEILEKQDLSTRKLRSSLYHGYILLCTRLRELDRWDDADKVMKKYEDHLSANESSPIANFNMYGEQFDHYAVKMDIEKCKYYLEKTKALSANLPLTYKIQHLMKEGNMALLLDDYENALIITDSIISLGYQDGQEGFAESIKIDKISLLKKMGRYEEALYVLEEYKLWQDSLLTVEKNTQLNELRTIYEVDKLENEKEIRRQQLIIAIGGCILLLLALLIFIIYSRRLAKKNRMLYNQVQELNTKEKAVEQCLITRPEEGLTKEMQLFRQLSKVMRIENYFTDPDLSRKKLADILGTNEMYLAEAIKAGSGYTYSEYISNIRLQHALEILNNKPETTLDIVAIDSGHGSYSQFFRSFSKKYGISPSEYRKLSANKKEE